MISAVLKTNNHIIAVYEERKTGKEYIQQMKDQFVNEVNNNIIIQGTWESPIWRLWNEHVTFFIDFQLDPFSSSRITEKQCEIALKCAFIEHLHNFQLSSLRDELNRIKALVNASGGFPDLEVFLRPEYERIRPSSNIKFRRTFLTNIGMKKNEIEKFIIPRSVGQVSRRRSMAEFTSYFLFEEILEKAWETMTEEQRILYFPLYLYWKIGNIIPQRVGEFAIVPYDCLSIRGKYQTIKLRRTRLKSKDGVGVGQKRLLDYKITEFPILEETYDLIRWYINVTDDMERVDVDGLFIFFTPKGKVTNNTTAIFEDLLLRFYNEYFTDWNVISKDEFEKRFWTSDIREEESLYSDETIRIELADIRILSMINLVQNGCNPSMIRRFTGHETVAMDDWYSGNISSYLKSQALRELRREKVSFEYEEISQSRKRFLYRGCEGVEVDLGTCFSSLFKEGKNWDCFKVDRKCERCGYLERKKYAETGNKETEGLNERCADIENGLKRFAKLLNIKDSAGNNAELGTLAEQLRSEMEAIKDLYKKRMQDEFLKAVS